MTEFNKTNEVTSIESNYEAVVDDVNYNFNVRKVNGTLENITCNITKSGVYIGGMYQQNGQKSINIHEDENAQTHVAVLEEFLGMSDL